MARAADIRDRETFIYRLSGRRMIRTQSGRGSSWSIDRWTVAKAVAEEMVKSGQLEAADPGLLDGVIPQSYVLRGDVQ